MLRAAFFLSFLALAGIKTTAQDKAKIDSAGIQQTDSSRLHAGNKPDTIFNIPTLSAHGLDSLSPEFVHYKHSLDSSKRKLRHSIDSLNRLKLPTAHYTHKLDSINRIDPLKSVKQQQAKLRASENKVTGAIAGEEKKLTQKINALTQDAKGEIPKPDIPGNIPTANIPGANLNVPGANLNVPNANLNIPGANLPNTSLPAAGNPLPQINNPATGEIQKEMNSITGAPQKELSELKLPGEVGTAEKEIAQATKTATGAEKEISSVAKNDVQSAEHMPQTLENEAKNVSGVKDLQKETQQLDSYKKMAAQAGSEEQLEQQAKQQAVNHFAGKEQILKGAMGQISKLKQKYKSLNSLSEIPKRIPNEMHGKPLIERIVPGFTFDVLKQNRQTLSDLNVWAGYRLTGHITTGAGWNERIAISHWNLLNLHVYGPRVFGDYKVGKGISFRAEVETMNTFIPPNQVPPLGDPKSRRWVWSTFAGMKRDYKLFKRIKGNVQMLYNVSSLFTHHRINIYGDPLTVRMGFEFPMKKKIKNK